MPMTSSDQMATPPDHEIVEEDALRAQAYALLAQLLARPPQAEDLAKLTALGGDASPFGRAIAELAQAAGRITPDAVRHEYEDLFIGVGRGELVPYGSYYLTGFLNEKPLARLRVALAALGLERLDAVHEPEDHVAALMEVMAGLIDGRFGDGSLSGQKRFFDAHVASWAHHFFRDLEGAAKASAFYAAVGRVGRIFLEIEETAFTMA